MKHVKTLAAIISLSTLWSCNQGMKEFKTLKGGTQYKIVKDKSGDKKAVEGNILLCHVTQAIGDSTLSKSRDNSKTPVPIEVAKPSGSIGDIMEVMPFLTKGDSVIIQIPTDSILKMNQGMAPPFIKPGQFIKLFIQVEDVLTKSEYEKYKEDMAKKQKDIDDKALNEYFKKNNLKPTKTASGLYYTINQAGSGENAKAGQQVNMVYTGKLLDGTKFDSNEDPAFQHMEPFEFVLGQGMVIPGWDEGIALMNKGTKATLYIPSSLAYGEREMPGSPANPKGIPANSSLVFDVELLEISEAKAPKAPPISAAPTEAPKEK